MEPRKSVKLTDGLVRTVLMYGGLRTARKMFGDDHPYIQNRAARTLMKAVRNMSGLVIAMKTLNELDAIGSWVPRAYFCLYPKPCVHRWHQTSSGWKRQLLSDFLQPSDFERDLTRLELFRLHRRMNPYDIVDIGW